jgi:hypothetical protein
MRLLIQPPLLSRKPKERKTERERERKKKESKQAGLHALWGVQSPICKKYCILFYEMYFENILSLNIQHL